MGYVEDYADSTFPVPEDWSAEVITEHMLERLATQCAAVAGALSVSRKGQREFRRGLFHLMRAWQAWSGDESINLSEDWRSAVQHAADGLGIITPEDAEQLFTAGKALQLDEFFGDHARAVRTDIAALASWGARSDDKAHKSFANKGIQKLINEMNGVEYAMREVKTNGDG